MLMFLCIARYISKLNAHVEQMRQKKIILPDVTICEDDIVEIYLKDFKELLYESCEKF